MNFFEHQAVRRRNTRKLLFLFFLAVLGTIAGVYLLCSPLWQPPDSPTWILWNPEAALYISIAVSIIILIGALHRLQTLKGGGAAIARALGGREIKPGHLSGLAEKRLYNVVEEMAIASGTPIPRIFILDQENGINAFAAGYSIQDAAIAVSRGCLEQLTRDELQGVVAHEFSHILNGDMRLNIRLIAILAGILFLTFIGRVLIEIGGRSRSDRNTPSILLILGGLGLILIGYIGVFFGRLIQAAVSRQREYLADASAVQFTRNPNGIAGALTKIMKWKHGAEIHNPMAVETSHMFFAQAITYSLARLFATHPPLEKRIAAIKQVPIKSIPKATPSTPHTAFGQPHLINHFIHSIGQVTQNPGQIANHIIPQIHPDIWQSCHHPSQVQAIILALLLSGNKTVQDTQLKFIQHDYDEDLCHKVTTLHSLLPSKNSLRWLILQAATPALRETPSPQREKFLHLTRKLTLADGRLNLFEFTIEILLEKWLQAIPPQRRPLSRSNPTFISATANLLLALAKTSYRDNPEALAQALHSGWQLLFLNTPPPEHKEVTYRDLRESLLSLDATEAETKELLLTACVTIVTHDQKIYEAEKDLLRMIALIWDCPLPLELD
ncbi:MAG: M48 family metallopeptidase [Methylacidiphilales bacterium]|nr:M48 family metallopeptidase [Candidatus Methylacidiphilales bacterium]MDW8350068.1 M48 family metallopeptidase [Verrucomicrobiae bacterium]